MFGFLTNDTYTPTPNLTNHQVKLKFCYNDTWVYSKIAIRTIKIIKVIVLGTKRYLSTLDSQKLSHFPTFGHTTIKCSSLSSVVPTGSWWLAHQIFLARTMKQE